MHLLLRCPLLFPLALALLDASDPSGPGEVAAGSPGASPVTFFVQAAFVSGAAVVLVLLIRDCFVRATRPGRTLDGGRRTPGQRAGRGNLRAP